MNENSNMNMNMLMMALGRSLENNKPHLEDYICNKISTKESLFNAEDVFYRLISVFGGISVLEKLSLSCNY